MAKFAVKLLVLSLLVLGSAYLLARYHVPILMALKEYSPSLYTWLMTFHKPKSPVAGTQSSLNQQASPDTAIRLFTKDELSAHGSDADIIYLAILGQVFDVTKGQKHYGKEGGYKFFSGIDGSRAYVTGDFDEKGLVENVADFDAHQCSELKHWTGFYHENYKFIGHLIGNFYDAQGKQTPALETFLKCAEAGDAEKEATEKDRVKYPPCNSRWSKAEGGYISCAPGSGGIERDWGGVPRQYFRPGQTDPRCACIRTNGLSGEGTDTGNRGDLDNPNFKVYEGCDPMAIECKIS